MPLNSFPFEELFNRWVGRSLTTRLTPFLSETVLKPNQGGSLRVERTPELFLGFLQGAVEFVGTRLAVEEGFQGAVNWLARGFFFCKLMKSQTLGVCC